MAKPSKPPSTNLSTVKPLFRGVFHQYGAFVALVSGIVLIASCPNRIAVLASSIYAASLVLLLGASALYHRITWSHEAQIWMRRLDHSSIFLLIAGTYTPICLLALPPPTGHHILTVVWSGAAAGVLKCLFWAKAPKYFSSILYVVLGWIIVFYASELSTVIDPFGFNLMLAGGICYTVGAVIYTTRWPDPFPKIFGYHEVFHALVIIACVFHFSEVVRLVHQPQQL